jgi:hypothetical protein
MKKVRQLQRQSDRPAGAAAVSQITRPIVRRLGGEYAAFERDDLGKLRSGRRRLGLGMSKRGVRRLYQT